MKNRTLMLLLLMCVCITLKAAPLSKVPVTVVQPNGDTLHCFASGDEYFNYLHDANGYVIIRDKATSYYVYAMASGDTLAPSTLIPGRDMPQKAGIQPYTLGTPQKITAKVNARLQAKTASVHPATIDAKAAATPNRNRGIMNNIIILIHFSDDESFTLSDRRTIETMFQDTAKPSLKTYYNEVSYGLLDVNSDFYPKDETKFSYKDNHPRAYYTKDGETGYATDEQRTERELTLLKNAIDSVKAQIPADLNIDMDNDGFVDNIIFVIKDGPMGWDEILWPHQWSFFDPYTTTINGKIARTFNLQLENVLLEQGISTVCHEFFHSLGAPDLYHYTNGKELTPVGSWDIMDANTSPPQHMSAYMKHKYGNWIDSIPEAVTPDVTLKPLNSSTPDSVCYKISSPSTPDEYYVLEFRKKTTTGIESQLPGSGLLIYRINTKFYGNTEWNGEDILDEVYLFRPNGTKDKNGDLDKAFFSAEAKRTYFDDSTNPSCVLSDGTLDHISVFFISSADSSTMTFSIINTIEHLTIVNDTVRVGNISHLNAVIYPPEAHGNLQWDVKEVTGTVDFREKGLILGRTPGIVILRVNVEANKDVFTEKRVAVVDEGDDATPAMIYWDRGMVGLLTIENLEGISKVELYSYRGGKPDEQIYTDAPNETLKRYYDFTPLPRGIYFVRAWNGAGTKQSTVKVLW